MTSMHGLRARLRLLFRRNAEERMDEEMSFHLEMEADRLVREEGLHPAEARRRAVLAFGGVEAHKEEMREGRTLAWTGGLSLDLKLALRMLRKYPGLTLIGGLGMALGVAISVGFFSAMATFAFPSIPLEEGDRVVAVEHFDAAAHNEVRPSVHDLALWREEVKSVRELAAFRTVERNLMAAGGEIEPLTLAEMTAAGFQVARVPPLLGRYFVQEDERRGASPVIVIGYDAWQDRFRGDRNVVGRSLRLDGRLYTVVGVMPEGFAFPVKHQYWIPLQTDLAETARRESPSVFVFGRLAPGIGVEEAQAEITEVGRRMAAAYPDTHARLRPLLSPYTYPLLGMERGVSVWALAQAQLGVTLLLIVVALNVAVLVYARTATRRGEIAVRSALGASRGRIVGQLFAEALVLSLGAAALGLAFAQLAIRILFRVNGGTGSGDVGTPFWVDYGLRPTTVLFTISLAALAAVIVGVVPAVKATGSRLQGDLRQLGGSTGLQLGKTWTLMVLAQVAIAVAALPAAVKIGWDTIPNVATRPTYHSEQFLSARLDLDAETASPGAFGERLTEVMTRLEAEPSVEGIAYQASLPDRGGIIRVEDLPAPSESPSGHWVDAGGVHPGYFELFDAGLLAGRQFAPGDHGEAGRAVIVNEAFVRQVLGGGSALGRRIRHVDRADEDDTGTLVSPRWYEIVGVVEDLETNRMDPDLVQPRLFYPVAPSEAMGATLAIRLRGAAPEAFGRRLREIAVSVDPSLRLGSVRSLADEGFENRFAGVGVALIVALVLLFVFLLSAAGIYALMSLTVTQRRREIGIRTALGASPRQVLRGVFTRAAAQIALGLAAGAALALVVERLSGGELMGGRGEVILPALAGAMTVVGLLAAVGPARRGLRIQPIEALREQ